MKKSGYIKYISKTDSEDFFIVKDGICVYDSVNIYSIGCDISININTEFYRPEGISKENAFLEAL